MKDYKFDIAISLCKQDVDFAYKLTKELNPKLNVFFYETRQEQMISELGPEKFGSIFKLEARVVVILYREAWGESRYTQLEKSAIIDRTGYPNEGQDFIVMIPLEKGETPGWYPESRIYASPFRFEIEELARFIEYKVTDRGGEVEPLTFEEELEHFNDKLFKRKKLIQYLQSTESYAPAIQELNRFISIFNSIFELLKSNSLPLQIRVKPFEEDITTRQLNSLVEIGLQNYLLRINLYWFPHDRLASTSQAFHLIFDLLHQIKGSRENFLKPVLQSTYRFRSETEYLYGWAKMRQIKSPESFKRNYFFETSTFEYDLEEIISSTHLLDHWLKIMFNKVKIGYNDIL